MASSKVLYTVVVVLLAALLISSTFAGYYVLQYDRAQSNANTYLAELKTVQPTQSTNILFDLGNGTSHWYNQTQVQTGSNLYNATVFVSHGNLNATWYPGYDEHLVTGIDGIQNSATQSWFLWTYAASSGWAVASVGADLLIAFNGSVFAWTYCNFNSTTYAPDCSP
jgi:hypothetical protein